MSALPTSNSDVLVSEQQWRRWEQRGFDNGMGFTHRVYRFLWTPLMLAAVLLLLFWMLR